MLRGENTPCRRRRARENKLDSRLLILKYEECATPPQAADGRKMKTRKHGVSACALLVACVSAVAAIAGIPCGSIYNINEAEHLDLYAPCLGDVQSSFSDLAYEIEENAIYCLQNQENNSSYTVHRRLCLRCFTADELILPRISSLVYLFCDNVHR